MKRFVALLLTLVAMLAMMVPAPAHAAPTCSAERLGSSANISIICRDDSGNIIPTPLIDIIRIVGNIVTVVVTETREVVRIVVEEVLVPGPVRTVTAAPQPAETVTVRPEPIPGATVTVRPSEAPRATVTVRPAPVEKTVTVPSETKTVTVQEPRATATATVTVRPNGTTTTILPRPQASATPESTPTVTVTATPSPPAGQIVPRDDTVEDGDTGFFRVDVGDDGEITVVETGIGLLSAALIFLIVLYAMYIGYGRGQRDAKTNETKFLRSVLDRSKIR